MEILTQTLLGGIIAGAVLLTFLAFLLQKGRISTLLRSNLLNAEALSRLMEQMEWENELDPLIDKQLDALTASLKQKNAMISMFLTPAVVDPLKEEGKAKLLEMAPAVEEKLAKYASSSEVAEKLETHLKQWIKQKMGLLLASAMLLGAIFGFFAGILLKLS